MRLRLDISIIHKYNACYLKLLSVCSEIAAPTQTKLKSKDCIKINLN